ncbi:MAG: ASKHA domain-containing protein [Christensenellales bacterium]|jgi:uncharacterized 2Fe-2S/4Fe-4S cluster protein (DUF4445 family)
MYRVTLIEQEKQAGIINAVSGANLLDLLTQNGIFIAADCGRRGVCGKCGVIVEAGGGKRVVNSCQYVIRSDITVYLPKQAGDSVKITPAKRAGAAFDIGTTSLAAYYVDLDTGKASGFNRLNKQAAFGADVLNRIRACEEGRLVELHATIIAQLNEMLALMPDSSALPAAISANNVMLHILAGVDPSPLGKYPFTPSFTDARMQDGADLGLNCASVCLLPSVSAYFGADAVCGIASLDLPEKKGVNLFIDIGTNAEMAIIENGEVTACVAAAGPAFEGANIQKGMGGVDGAIDRVYIEDGKMAYSVIGNAQPMGICGSGLVDTIALLLEHSLIDFYGTFTDRQSKFSQHIADGKFYLSKEVFVSQADIREFQLAKSAVYTGIMTLLNAHKLTPSDIDNVYIAGGLGYYIDKTAAVKTGILPREFEKKAISAGNTSGLGAVRSLLEKDFLQKCRDLSARVKVIELAQTEGFMDKFVENMNFYS